MAETIIKGILGSLLFLCTLQDLYKRKVYLWMMVLAAVMLVVCIVFTKEPVLTDRIGGMLIGIGVMILSKATRGKIGMGDGYLLCVTGLGLGFWSNLELFALGLFFAAILSILLLILRVIQRKSSIPFIPFLMIGYLILLAAPTV